MKKFEQLMKLISSTTVRNVELQEIVDISNTGGDKKIVEGEGIVSLLNYMDVVRNPRINARTLTAITSASTAKQTSCSIRKGDVFITPSSETVNEIGISAFAEEDIPNAVYSYHVMRLRPKNLAETLPEYLMYLFRSGSMQSQITRQARGITRFGLTLPHWKALQLPVPPLHIQEEIVRVLDSFAALEDGLKAELEARNQQFTYVLNASVNFEDRPDIWRDMSQVAEVRSGWGFPHSHQGSGVGEIPFYKVSDMNLHGNETKMFAANNYVNLHTAKKLGVKPAPAGTVIFPKIGAAVGTNKKRLLTKSSAYDNNVMGLVPASSLDSQYLYYWMQTFDLLKIANNSGAVPSIRKSEMESLKIPVPSLREQCQIAEKLSKLDDLVNSITLGLPAELEARRAQFEFYRDHLLAFTEA